jgi:type II secretory pathway component PulF
MSSTLSIAADSGRGGLARYRARSEFLKLRADLYRSLAYIYSSPLPAGQLVGVLGVVAESLEARGRPAGPALIEAIERLRSGEQLSRAMDGIAPPADLMTMAAYEQQSALGPMFSTLARTSQQQREISRRLPALLMPLWYLVILVALLAMFSLMLVPTMKQASPVERWPGYARVFAYLAEFIAGHPLQILAGIVALALLYRWSLPNWVGAVRTRLDGTWLYAWYRDMRAADLLSGLAAQLGGGVKLPQALASLRERSQPYLAYWIDEIERRLTIDPSVPLTALRVALIHDDTSDAIEMLRLGGSSPGPILDVIGREAYETALRRIERIAGNAGRFFLLLTGCMVAWSLLSIIMPILTSVDSAQQQQRQINRPSAVQPAAR